LFMAIDWIHCHWAQGTWSDYSDNRGEVRGKLLATSHGCQEECIKH
jgi:hypothetical protein